MINGSRFSLAYFLLWAFAVVSLTAYAGGQKTATAMSTELTQEIENLEVIQKVNGGEMNSDQIALVGDSSDSTEVSSSTKSHRTPRRTVLSQR